MAAEMPGPAVDEPEAFSPAATELTLPPNWRAAEEATIVSETHPEARILSLEEAKESRAELVLPPAVDPEVAQTAVHAAEQPEAGTDPLEASRPSIHFPVGESIETTVLLPPATERLDTLLALENIFASPLPPTSEALDDINSLPLLLPAITSRERMPFGPFVAESFQDMESSTPEQTFDHFAGSLAALSKQSGEEEAALGEDSAELAPIAGQQMLVAVSERLAVLDADEKEAAMPIVQQIAEAIVEMRQLQAVMAGPMELAQLEEHITELSEALLETIGIAYDETSLKQFVQNLLRPELMPELTRSADEVDLERMGTHEVKRHFPQFFATIADLFADMPAHDLLGKFVLLCESLSVEWQERPRARSDSMAA